MSNLYNNRIAADVLTEYLGGKCLWCGSCESLQFHHTLPKYLGGTDSISNIELLCFKCHRQAHSLICKMYIKDKKGRYARESVFQEFFNITRSKRPGHLYDKIQKDG